MPVTPEIGQTPVWRLLAYTGMRRGELLALRWRDVDLDAGRLHVRRSRSGYREKGQGMVIHEGITKTGRGRVVDLDPGTIEVLKAYRLARGTLALQLIRPDAYVVANEDGLPIHPDRFTRRFTDSAASCRKTLGEDGAELLPAIRLHDLRHTTRRCCWVRASPSMSSPSVWVTPAQRSP